MDSLCHCTSTRRAEKWLLYTLTRRAETAGSMLCLAFDADLDSTRRFLAYGAARSLRDTRHVNARMMLRTAYAMPGTDTVI
eukprot:31461-Rhodomonas_salina.1